jgi:hypothetical protein
MLGPKKPIKIIPSWYTNQMMYAVDIDQPTISGCYVPLDVGLASSADAVSFQDLPLICSAAV